jgi:hypothetical protein
MGPCRLSVQLTAPRASSARGKRAVPPAPPQPQTALQTAPTVPYLPHLPSTGPLPAGRPAGGPVSGRISPVTMPRHEQAECRLIPSREIARDINRNRRGVSPAVLGMVSSQLLVAAAVARWAIGPAATRGALAPPGRRTSGRTEAGEGLGADGSTPGRLHDATDASWK